MSIKCHFVGLSLLEKRVLDFVNDPDSGVTKETIEASLQEDGMKISIIEIDFSLQKLMGKLPGHSKIYVAHQGGRYYPWDPFIRRLVRSEILELVPESQKGDEANHCFIMNELVQKRKRPQEIVLAEFRNLRDDELISDVGGGIFLKLSRPKNEGEINV